MNTSTVATTQPTLIMTHGATSSTSRASDHININTIIITVLFSLTGIIVLYLNILLSWIILKHKKLRKRPNVLLLNILLSNILFFFAFLPRIVLGIDRSRLHDDSKKMNLMCQLHLYMSYSFGVVNVNGLANVSMDRYIAIAHPFHYIKHMGRRYFWFLIILPWMNGLLCTMPIAVKNDWVVYTSGQIYTCDMRWHNVDIYYASFLLIVCIVLPLATLLFTNIRVYRLTKNHIEQRNKMKARPSRSWSDVYNQAKQGNKSADRDPREIENGNRSNIRSNLGKPQSNVADNETGDATGHLEMAVQDTEECKIGNHLCRSTMNLVALRSMCKEGNVEQSENSNEIGVFEKGAHVESSNSNSQLRIVISTYFLILSFVCGCLPLAVMQALKYTNRSFMSNTAVYYILVFPVVLSAANPIIILLTRKEISTLFKKETKRYFDLIIPRKGM